MDQRAIADILRTEQEWVQALRDVDLSAIDRILAEDYTQVRDDGRVARKKETLESFQGMQRHWDVAESTEHDVRVIGDVAVVLGLWRASGQNHGSNFNYRARFSAVYVKRDGRWQLMADHSTPIVD